MMTLTTNVRWDFATSVEEVMTHLHAAVMAKQVLYLGVSNTPAWVVVKANECMSTLIYLFLTNTNNPIVARKNGLTPFTVYEVKWNAVERDAEAEIIPMCEDQGMGLLTWASLGGGSILTAKQRAEKEEAIKKSDDSGERPPKPFTENQIKVCNVLEKLAEEKKTSIQAIVRIKSDHKLWRDVLTKPPGMRISLFTDNIRHPNHRRPDCRAR